MSRFYRGFIRAKVSSLSGDTEVRYTQQGDQPAPFTVVASPKGVEFKGELKEPLSDQSDLEGFAKLVASAWKDYQTLKPKLNLSASGH
jgi:hypothetical protein